MQRMKRATTEEERERLRGLQRINKERALKNPNENWMEAKLLTFDKWERQHRWGYRIFDFWDNKHGIVIEVDGDEHDKNYDQYRDEVLFRTHAIVTLRVKNRNEAEAAMVLAMVKKLQSLGIWLDRKKAITLTKKRHADYYLELPESHSMLTNFLLAVHQGETYVPPRNEKRDEAYSKITGYYPHAKEKVDPEELPW